jgi:hypothetical protein
MKNAERNAAAVLEERQREQQFGTALYQHVATEGRRRWRWCWNVWK